MTIHTQNIVIGGGIAGLCCAFNLVQAEQSVILVEQNRLGERASSKAAGMITPASEAHLGENDLIELFLKATDFYPSFINQLTNNQNHLVDYQQNGSLLCATDPNGQQDLLRLAEFQKSMGLDIKELDPDSLSELEPELSHQVKLAFFAKNEAHVDNNRLLKALEQYLINSKRCQILENKNVTHIESDGQKIQSITIGDTESLAVKADRIILTTGLEHNIPELKGLLPMRPVKGQVFVVHCGHQTIQRPVRLYHRYPIYLVPRQDGRLIIGATSEELNDTDLTAGALMDLIYAAWQALPMIYDAPIVETRVGQRPATPDNKPIVGQTSLENLFVLNGLYRHGIMAAPFLSNQLIKLILDQDLQINLDPYNIERFSK